MKLLSGLFIGTFPFFLLFFMFFILVFNTNFYYFQFERNEIYKQIPKDKAKVQTLNLLNYFSKNEALDKNYYSQREISHLADVKNLINKTLQVFKLVSTVFILLLVILFIKEGKSVIKYLNLAAKLTLLVFLSLTLLLLANFNFFFLNFHYLFFDNDLWQLPQNSNLLILFPQQFFNDFITVIFSSTIIISLLIVVLNKLLSKLWFPKV